MSPLGIVRSPGGGARANGSSSNGGSPYIRQSSRADTAREARYVCVVTRSLPASLAAYLYLRD